MGDRSSDERRLFVFSSAEVEFLKDALWCACVVEQLAATADAAWERAFLEDLRSLVRSRQEQGKAGFQDLFLELAGTSLADLPPDLRQYFGREGLGPPREADTVKLIGALRAEIGQLTQQLEDAHRALAIRRTSPKRRWWPFRRSTPGGVGGQ